MQLTAIITLVIPFHTHTHTHAPHTHTHTHTRMGVGNVKITVSWVLALLKNILKYMFNMALHTCTDKNQPTHSGYTPTLQHLISTNWLKATEPLAASTTTEKLCPSTNLCDRGRSSPTVRQPWVLAVMSSVWYTARHATSTQGLQSTNTQKEPRINYRLWHKCHQWTCLPLSGSKHIEGSKAYYLLGLDKTSKMLG